MVNIKTFIAALFMFLLCSLQAAAQENREFLITAKSAGDFSLGMPIKDALSLAKKKYKVEEIENGFLISLKEEKLLYLTEKRGDGNVGFIEIHSPKYHTKDGLRIGTSIAEAIKGKKIKMGYDGIEDEEYLAPDEFQVPNDRFYESLCLFYVKSNSEGLLGEYDFSDNEESTYNYKTNGTISKIIIYYWD